MAKRHDDNHSTISGTLNNKRKFEVRNLMLSRPDKLDAHVMPTFNRETGEPDGGTTSAFRGFGGVCMRCGITRADAQETVEGAKCNAKAFRRFFAGEELDAVGRGGQPTNIASPARTLIRMESMITANNYGRDPLGDIFAA